MGKRRRGGGRVEMRGNARSKDEEVIKRTISTSGKELYPMIAMRRRRVGLRKRKHDKLRKEKESNFHLEVSEVVEHLSSSA
eukprot:767593-Hanusia_phi.AAC.1